MTKSEFEKATCATVTDSEYEVIETVYMYHPAVSNTEGKVQIANLYCTMGIRVIMDMVPTAHKARNIEQAIYAKKQELNDLQEALNELRNPLV